MKTEAEQEIGALEKRVRSLELRVHELSDSGWSLLRLIGPEGNELTYPGYLPVDIAHVHWKMTPSGFVNVTMIEFPRCEGIAHYEIHGLVLYGQTYPLTKVMHVGYPLAPCFKAGDITLVPGPACHYD